MLARHPTRDALERLEEENRQLKARIAGLTGQNLRMAAKRAFGVSNLQAGLIILLVTRGEATRDQIIDALYDHDRQAMLSSTYFAVGSLVKHVRKVLRRHSIEIETLYSFGYSMSEEGRAAARRIMGGAQ